MPSRFPLLPLLGFGLLVCVLGGCIPKDSVNLSYHPVTPSVLPSPSAPRVTVVLFEDKRGKQEIGVRQNQTPFTTSASVTQWVSRALADELSRMGPQVSFALNTQMAQSAAPDYIITGSVEDVWLKESSPATYSATVSIRFSMADRSGVVYAERLSATQEKTGLPNSSIAVEVLTEALREVLGVAASKISEATR